MYFGSRIFVGGLTCDHRFQSFEIVCIIICISADLFTLLHCATIIFHISTDFRGLVAQRNSNPLRYRHGHSTTPSGQRRPSGTDVPEPVGLIRRAVQARQRERLFMPRFGHVVRAVLHHRDTIAKPFRGMCAHRRMGLAGRHVPRLHRHHRESPL